jgi:lipopolysaccharide biosynthesis regulator YciM
MPNENTPEYARVLYEHAALITRGPDIVYAARLLERVIELRDPFYTPFALALLESVYKRLGREDLVEQTIRRVTQLAGDQQILLNPAWVASCYQRTGDTKAAKVILATITKLAPEDPLAMASLSEIALVEGHPDQAYVLSESLRRRPEPAFQILGNTLGAVALIFQGLDDGAAKELSWVGQFLVSTGSVPPSSWDYRDLRDMITTKARGVTAAAAVVLLDALAGKISIADFAPRWSQLMLSLQPAAKN